MAITYIGAGAVTANTTATTACVVAYPSGILAGDLLVMPIAAMSQASGPYTAPGFTRYAKNAAGGLDPSTSVYVRVATGSESGTVSTPVDSGTNQAVMFLFRGVDPVTPIDVTETVYGTSTATTAYTIPSLTTTRTGVALFVFAASTSGSSNQFTPPSTPAAFTEVYDAAAALPPIGVSYLIWSGSGATGTINQTRTTSVRGCASALAFRPLVPVMRPPNIRVFDSATSRSFTW